MSEIDEIFTSKSPLKSGNSTDLTQKRPKNKKRRRDAKPAKTSAPTSSHPAPEIVLDPSTSLPSSKRVKHSKNSSGPKASVKESDFIDSRGAQSRRKTEEGWNIYKEDELGIRDEGGNTPLCPFDCDCCY